MFVSTRKPTGTTYTATVALVVAALFFSPAVLLLSAQSSYSSIFIAFAFSMICLGLARFTSARSQLSISTLQCAPSRAK